MSSQGQLNSGQWKAVSADGVSVILASGAGCGKTTVLTERYLRYLEVDCASVGQIVAITFTERAARQMRQRIRERCERNTRQNELGNTTAWQQHLQALETAPITTIHSFCGNLLRQYALQVGLDPEFEIIEEAVAETVRSQAIRRRQQELLVAQSSIGEDLRELIVDYGWSTCQKALQELLRDADFHNWDYWLQQPSEVLASAWAQFRDHLLPNYWKYILDGPTKLGHALRVLRLLEPTSPMQQQLAELRIGTQKWATSQNRTAMFETLLELANFRGSSKKAWPDEESYDRTRDTLELYRASLREACDMFTEEAADTIPAIEVGKRFLRVARELSVAYQQVKQRQGMLDFQDLLVMARDLIRDHAEIREHLQKRYAFIMVDELQDTDPIQMEIVRLLCGPGLKLGRLFAVGDHKQSIYRFRGAEVQLFQQLRAEALPEGRLLLSENYRSQPPILHFVNLLFAERIEDYDRLVPVHAGVSAEPCIEFLWTFFEPLEGKSTVDACRRAEAATLAQRIEELLADDRPRIREGSTGRLVRSEDIVLLFRSMSNVAIYEEALRDRGIDYYLVGGSAFFAQQEIYDLLNVLRTIENPTDSLSLAGTLRSPFFALSDEVLFLLGTQKCSLWEALQQHAAPLLAQAEQIAVARASRLLSEWRTLKDRVSIPQLLSKIVADSGYDAALQFEFLGERKLANLWKLIEMARAYDRSGNFTLADYVSYLEELISGQAREELAATLPEEANVVRLMTIHQAKGLEFPVVILPEFAAANRGAHVPIAHWQRNLGCLVRPPDEDPPLFSDWGYRLGKAAERVAEWHEELRVLYVGCTRARDLLILSAGLPERFESLSQDTLITPRTTSPWLTLLCERFSPVTGAFIGSDPGAETIPRIHVRVVDATDSAARQRGTASLPAILQDPPLPPKSYVRRSRNRLAPNIVPLPVLEYARKQGSKLHPGSQDAWKNSLAALESVGFSRSVTFREMISHVVPRLFLPEETLLWHLIHTCDIHQKEDWLSRLMDIFSASSDLALEASRSRLMEYMKRFEESSFIGQLRRARWIRRELELWMDRRILAEKITDGEIRTMEPHGLLWSWVDFLWEDEAGQLHTCALDLGNDRGVKQPWKLRKSFQILATTGISHAFHRPVRSLGLFDFSTGAFDQVDARRVKLEAALNEVRSVVQEFDRAFED